MDQNAKQQIAERIKDANNILITVSSNPSVDQLSACIGLTLLVNRLGKHGTAVFSGEVPSTIEFLKPEDTLEANTNSLRDFIIALDKSKADKLRYKVEDKVVKIFITPYRTSLSQDDLIFSQGDFNVDVVIGLGVHEREDLDQAITAHGRILHDATVISVNNHDQGNLGAINWVDLNASSLSEMVLEIVDLLTRDGLDGQMATALMTGIVAETERFSNEKTTPRTMTLASQLLGAGANQQLIASKLEEAQPIPEDKGMGESTKSANASKPKKNKSEPPANADGSLQIEHDKSLVPAEQPASVPPPPAMSMLPPLPPPPQQPIPQLPPTPPMPQQPFASSPKPHLQYTNGHLENPSNLILQPPTLGGRLTANTVPEDEMGNGGVDLFGSNTVPPAPMLNRNAPPASMQQQPAPAMPLPPQMQQPLPLAPQPYLPSTQLPPSPMNNMPPAPQPQSLPPTPAPPPPPPPPPITPPPPMPPSMPTPPPPPASSGGASESVAEAREAVDEAIKGSNPDDNLEPIVALGAQPVNLNLRDEPPADTGGIPAAAFQATPAAPQQPMSLPSAQQMPGQPPQPAPLPAELPIGSTITPVSAPTIPVPDDDVGHVYAPQILNPTTPPQGATASPPPVPPPMMPSMAPAPGQDGIAL